MGADLRVFIAGDLAGEQGKSGSLGPPLSHRVFDLETRVDNTMEATRR